MKVRFSMVTRLFFSSDEEGQFAGSVSLIDPDGLTLLSAPIELGVPISELDGTGVFIDSIGEIEITFRKRGEHQFHLSRNGGEATVIPLYVSSK